MSSCVHHHIDILGWHTRIGRVRLLLLDINVGLLGMTRLWRLNWLLLIGLHLAILLWRVSRLRWIALLLRVTLLWLIALLRRTVFLLGLVRLWLTITLLRWIGNLL